MFMCTCNFSVGPHRIYMELIRTMVFNITRPTPTFAKDNARNKNFRCQPETDASILAFFFNSGSMVFAYSHKSFHGRYFFMTSCDCVLYYFTHL